MLTPTIASQNRIYLVSRSPRRRELLKQIGVHFELLLLREHPAKRCDVDETPLPGEPPDQYVLRICNTKAELALQRIHERHLPALPLLAADTTVVLDGQIIGKPANAEDAAATLKRLSNRTHQVYTAVAVANGASLASELSTSQVTFRALDEAEIRRYVQTGEPLDKAGSYGIQGRAAVFISRLEGSYSGVMGLPLFETAQLLKRPGISVL